MTSRSPSPESPFYEKDEMLPSPITFKRRIRLRSLLGHYLYRRVVLWIATAFLVLVVILFARRPHGQDGSVLEFVRLRGGHKVEEEPVAPHVDPEPEWVNYTL